MVVRGAFVDLVCLQVVVLVHKVLLIAYLQPIRLPVHSADLIQSIDPIPRFLVPVEHLSMSFVALGSIIVILFILP